MKYIKGFDTLRALSISLVVIGHILPNSWIPEKRIWLLFSGETGVLIFFVISGFLITSLLKNELNKNGIINFKNFFIRRFLRLLPPLVIFYLTVFIFMTFNVIDQYFIGLGISIFYLYNFVPNKFYSSELAHTWSLGLEEQFYFTWPFVLQYIKKSQWLLLVGGVIIILSIVFFYLIYPTEFMSHFKAHRWFIPGVTPIIIGAMLAIISPSIKHFEYSIPTYLVGFFILFMSPLWLHEDLLIIAPMFQSIGIVFLLITIIHTQDSLFIKGLNNPYTSYIGKISYGIYVYQGLFLRNGPGSENWFQQFPQNLVFTLVCAILSFEYIEKYFLNKKKKYSVS